MDCRFCYFCRAPFRPSRVDQFLCTSAGSSECYDRLLRLNQAADNFKIQYGAKVSDRCMGCQRDDLPLQLILRPGAIDIWDEGNERPWAVIVLPLDWLMAMCKDCRTGFQLWAACNG